MTVRNEIEAHIDRNIVEWVDETVGYFCRDFAEIAGLPRHITESIHTEKTGFMEAEVRNDLERLTDSGVIPLGKFLNSGWGKGGYDIHVRWANALTWIDDFGKRKFAKKVRHPGFEGYHFMEDGKDVGMPLLMNKVKQEMETARKWVWEG